MIGDPDDLEDRIENYEELMEMVGEEDDDFGQEEYTD